jgi:hypothetical protein
MTKKFTEKNVKLSINFDKYLWSHPELLEQLPKKSTIVITVKGDSYFNRLSRSMHKNNRIFGKLIEARKEGSKWKILVP